MTFAIILTRFPSLCSPVFLTKCQPVFVATPGREDAEIAGVSGGEARIINVTSRAKAIPSTGDQAVAYKEGESICNFK
jgi:hypothetical protein